MDVPVLCLNRLGTVCSLSALSDEVEHLEYLVVIGSTVDVYVADAAEEGKAYLSGYVLLVVLHEFV